MTKVISIAFAAIAAALLVPASVSATPVYGTAVDAGNFSGSRTTGGGLGLLGAGTASISWSITDGPTLNDGIYHYSYTLTTTAQNTISHFILDLSDNCTAVGACFSNLVLDGTSTGTLFDSYVPGGNGNSDPGIPGTIVGVKLDGLSDSDKVFNFSFDSNRIPVWGDFYSKGGNPVVQPTKGYAVWDVGLADHTDGLIGDFIAVPDTQIVIQDCVGNQCCIDCVPLPVPEPGSLGLLFAALAAAGLFGANFGARDMLRRRRSAV